MNFGRVVPSLILFKGVDNKSVVVAPKMTEKFRFFNTENANKIKALIVYFTRDSKHWEKKNLLLSFHQTQIDITRFRYLTD
jgi:hypothetical protein